MSWLIMGKRNRKSATPNITVGKHHAHNRNLKAIGLGIRMYDLQPQWFKVADISKNYFVFTFDPGDLGKVRFHHTPLRWDNGALIMERQGRTMRYVKGRGR